MRNLNDEYLELLMADESTESLDRALRLAARAAAGEGLPTNVNAKRLLTPPADPTKPAAAATRRVDLVIWAMVKVAGATRRKVQAIPDGQYGFLLDVLLLVFHQAYFGLLPDAGQARERLLAAFAGFAATIPRPADQYHVRGLVALERGLASEAADAFRAAIASTHSDEHDFITRVQLSWSLLMERCLWSEAFTCLLDVYPRVARADLDELRSLLTRTFNESRHAPGQRPLAS